MRIAFTNCSRSVRQPQAGVLPCTFPLIGKHLNFCFPNVGNKVGNKMASTLSRVATCAEKTRPARRLGVNSLKKMWEH
jgi:hypothetical protein